jgi:hypothetical protein
MTSFDFFFIEKVEELVLNIMFWNNLRFRVMFLFNISTEQKAFIKKTQKPVFGISVCHDSTISYFILITMKLSKNTACHRPLHNTKETIYRWKYIYKHQSSWLYWIFLKTIDVKNV